MSAKIAADHLARSAVVYVRQSTMTQVLGNLESQKRQYALADAALLQRDHGPAAPQVMFHGVDRARQIECAPAARVQARCEIGGGNAAAVAP